MHALSRSHVRLLSISAGMRRKKQQAAQGGIPVCGSRAGGQAYEDEDEDDAALQRLDAFLDGAIIL